MRNLILTVALLAVAMPAGADGIIGDPINQAADIAAEPGNTATYRLKHGSKRDPGQPAVGYAEALITIKPEVTVEGTVLRVRLGGKLTELLNQSPMNLGALSWGFAYTNFDEVGDILKLLKATADGIDLPRQADVEGWAVFTLAEPITPGATPPSIALAVQISYHRAKQVVLVPAPGTPRPAIRVRDPRGVGFNREGRDAEPPPFLPYFLVTDDGHARLYASADQLMGLEEETRTTLRLYHRPVGGESFSLITSQQWTIDQDVLLSLTKGEDLIAIDFDHEFKEWWSQPAGSIKVSIATGGDQNENFHLQSPVISEQERAIAMRRRIEAWSRELFDLPFSSWYRLWKDDGDDARRALWRGTYRHATYCAIEATLDNLGEAGSSFGAEVRCLAVETSGKTRELGLAKILCTDRHDRPDWEEVPTGGSTRLRFSNLTLATTSGGILKALERIDHFLVAADPAPAGNPHPTAVALYLDPPQTDLPGTMLGRYMRDQQGTDPIEDTPPYKAYEQLLDQTINHAGLAVAEDKTQLLAGYQRFIDFVQVYLASVEATQGTALDELTLHLDHLAAQNFSFRFGDPHAGPGVSTGHDPGYSVERFNITHSGGEIALAAISAFAVSGLSYANMDPLLARYVDQSLGMGNLHGSKWVVAGVDVWANTGIASEYDDPKVAAAIGGMIDRGTLTLPPTMQRHLERANFNKLKGDLFEAMGTASVVRARLESLQEQAGAHETYVHVRGDQVRGPEEVRPGRISDKPALLSDDVIIKVTAPPGGPVTREIVCVVEMKSGTYSAQGLPGQLSHDLARFGRWFSLDNLDAGQQEGLRLGEGLHRLNGSDCPLRVSDDLFLVHVTRDAELPRVAGRDVNGLTPQQRRLVEQGMDNAQRSELGNDEINAATRALFARTKTVAHDVFDPTLYDRQVVAATKRNAEDRGVEPPTDAEIITRYRQGERQDPDTGEWTRVGQPWARPFIPFQEALAMARAAKPNEDPASVRNNVLAGMRVNPETGRWTNPAAGNDLAVVDPRNPFESADRVVDWMGSYRSGQFTEAEIRERCANGQVFDPEINQWRRPKYNPDKSGTANEVGRFGQRSQFDGELEIPGRGQTREVIGNAVQELVERASAGLVEGLRLGGNRLRVSVHASRNSPRAWIELTMEYIDQEHRRQTLVMPSECQQAVLMSWYRRRLPEGVKPLWMDHLR